MATKIIGKVLPDGRVKYIKCEDCETIFETARILLRFYKTESRVDALIELGNIYELGPSPYGRFLEGQNDKVHCAAMIRDFKHKVDEERAQVIDDKDVFIRSNVHAMLFDDGQWFFVHNRQILPVHTTADIPRPRREMDTYGLSVLVITRDSQRMKDTVISFHFPNWEEMTAKAFADDDTYHIFSHDRLVATINPKPTPNTLQP